MHRLRRLLRLVALCCPPGLLLACANRDTLAIYQTQSGAIALRQNPKGGYFVAVSPPEVLPLDGYTTAHIESIWEAPSARLVVIAGRRADCLLRYSLVVAKADGASITSIGDCGSTYSFTQDGGMFVIRQTGTRDERVWIFENGVLHGPMRVTTHVLRHPPQAAVASPAERATNPMVPPPISAPVGNEVIPPPVSSAPNAPHF